MLFCVCFEQLRFKEIENEKSLLYLSTYLPFLVLLFLCVDLNFHLGSFSFCLKNFFSLPCNTGLMINSLSFYFLKNSISIFWKIFIFNFSKHNSTLTAYFSFCTLNIFFYWLLPWMAWWEVCYILIFVPLYIINMPSFIWLIFKNFTLSLFFSNFIIIFIGVILYFFYLKFFEFLGSVSL